MKQNKSLREEIEELTNSSSNMIMSATSTGYDNFIDDLLSLIERERERAVLAVIRQAKMNEFKINAIGKLLKIERKENGPH